MWIHGGHTDDVSVMAALYPACIHIEPSV